jgi:hypothetical protein
MKEIERVRMEIKQDEEREKNRKYEPLIGIPVWWLDLPVSAVVFFVGGILFLPFYFLFGLFVGFRYLLTGKDICKGE